MGPLCGEHNLLKIDKKVQVICYFFIYLPVCDAFVPFFIKYGYFGSPVSVLQEAPKVSLTKKPFFCNLYM